MNHREPVGLLLDITVSDWIQKANFGANTAWQEPNLAPGCIESQENKDPPPLAKKKVPCIIGACVKTWKFIGWWTCAGVLELKNWETWYLSTSVPIDIKILIKLFRSVLITVSRTSEITQSNSWQPSPYALWNPGLLAVTHHRKSSRPYCDLPLQLFPVSWRSPSSAYGSRTFHTTRWHLSFHPYWDLIPKILSVKCFHWSKVFSGKSNTQILCILSARFCWDLLSWRLAWSASHPTARCPELWPGLVLDLGSEKILKIEVTQLEFWERYHPIVVVVKCPEMLQYLIPVLAFDFPTQLHRQYFHKAYVLAPKKLTWYCLQNWLCCRANRCRLSALQNCGRTSPMDGPGTPGRWSEN